MKKYILYTVCFVAIFCFAYACPSENDTETTNESTEQTTINKESSIYKEGYDCGKNRNFGISDPVSYCTSMREIGDYSVPATPSELWKQGYKDGYNGK